MRKDNVVGESNEERDALPVLKGYYFAPVPLVSFSGVRLKHEFSLCRANNRLRKIVIEQERLLGAARPTDSIDDWYQSSHMRDLFMNKLHGFNPLLQSDIVWWAP